jgi:hypothetical protein
MTESTKQLFNAIVTDDKEAAQKAFGSAIQDKLQDALEVKRVKMTGDIFNQTEAEDNVTNN